MASATPSLDTIFCTAVEIASVEDRAAYIARACGGDPELRGRVERLVKAHFQAGSFLESPAPEQADTVDDPITERPGSVIGPYKLLEQVGEGGFGIVFMAEQQQPLRRKVALKVLKPGMDTRQVIARFEAERQALALMDHPNIAHVYDGGETATGRPFFVMELVKGIPITDYCDQRQLTPRERLELFLHVGQAVQHAHQKGIIHRDLKPSNVLVTLHDGTPVVKVIDFGIAKATGRQLTDKTLFTNFAQLIGTPQYMSPEQALSGLDVDTRSDIYALGVLLYELLTGTTPFAKERFKEADYDEIRRILREEEPPRPSTRIGTLGQAATTLSTQRKSDPKRLRQLFRGELDWIVMKCLEKDRSRRYETVNGLAMDVRRYLHDEPVEACPPSPTYWLRKFVRRNRNGVVASGLLFLAVLAGLVGTTWGLFEALWERDQADQARTEESQQRGIAKQAEEKARLEEGRAKKNAELVTEEKRLSDRLFYASDMKLASLDWEAGQTELVLERLERQRTKRPGDEDRRGFEWYYLQRQCELDQWIIRGCSKHASVVFSPDGSRLVSVSENDSVKTWEIATRQEDLTLDSRAYRTVNSFAHGQYTPVALAFSPDGRHIASTGLSRNGHAVQVWDAANGQVTLTIRSNAEVRGLAFSPDSRLIAMAKWDGTVEVLDAAGGRFGHTLRGHKDSVFGVAFSCDGRRIASASVDNTVKVWDAANGKDLLTLRGHTDVVTGVAFSPDGRRIASASYDGTVKLWDTAGGKKELTLCGHRNWVNGVAFSPDGRWIASVSYDKTVKVWGVAAGNEILTLRGHTGSVQGVVFSPDGRRIASSSSDQTIRVWDVASGQKPLSLRGNADGSRPGVRGVAFSPDGGRIASAGDGHTVRVWKAATGQAILTIRGHAAHVFGVAFSPNGRGIASASIDQVRIWDAASGRETRAIDGQFGAVFSVAFSPDGRRIASPCEDRILRIWDVGSGKEVFALSGFINPAEALITIIRGHTDDYRDAVFSPDGRWLASATSNNVKLWDVATGKEKLNFRAHEALVEGVAFSPDGHLLASASYDGTVKVWDVATGQLTLTLRGHAAGVHSVAFCPDGQRLASASDDQTVKVWDVRTGQETLSLQGHSRPVRCVAWSHTGRSIVSASESEDQTIMVWEATDLTEAVRVQREASGLVSFLFGKGMSRDRAAATIRSDLTISEPLRREALAQLEGRWSAMTIRDAKKR
jgi:WD40 repeat protein/serine/threonine protein kinase